MDAPSAAELKAKWEATSWHASRDPTHPRDKLNLRLSRALSWLERAEQAHRDKDRDIEFIPCGSASSRRIDMAHCDSDHDTAFILYWIAFNAVYGQTGSAAYGDQPERDNQRACFRRIARLDQSFRVPRAARAIQDPIYALLHSKYVYEPFWKHHNGVPGYRDWEERLARRRHKAASALRHLRATTIAAAENIELIMSELFDRLYTLRNQLLHGGATYRGSKNREQVIMGTAAIAALLPHFIDVMIENPDADWGSPRYPVVND